MAGSTQPSPEGCGGRRPTRPARPPERRPERRPTAGRISSHIVRRHNTRGSSGPTTAQPGSTPRRGLRTPQSGRSPNGTTNRRPALTEELGDHGRRLNSEILYPGDPFAETSEGLASVPPDQDELRLRAEGGRLLDPGSQQWGVFLGVVPATDGNHSVGPVGCVDTSPNRNSSSTG